MTRGLSHFSLSTQYSWLKRDGKRVFWTNTIRDFAQIVNPKNKAKY